VSRKRRGKKQQHHYYPESVPPGMAHEVFDVSGADAAPASPAGNPAHSKRGVPSWSKPPPPPPRPSARPAQDDDAEELPADELEEDELDEEASGLSSRSAPILTPTSMETVAMPRAKSPVLALVLLSGVLMLGLGIVLGMRGRAAASKASTPAVTSEPTAVVARAADRILIPLPDPAPAVELPSEPPADLPSEAASASEPSAASGVATAWAAPAAEESTAAFDADAAGAAISAAFARAKGCRGPSDPKGEVTGTLTYAPSGRVTTATVSGIFAGTSVGGCVAATLRGARIAPFSGEHTTVKRTVTLD
jgi:hypothetical protein